MPKNRKTDKSVFVCFYIITELVGSKSKVEVLTQLLKFSGRSFTLTELSIETGVSISRVKSILDRFLGKDIVKKTGKNYTIKQCFTTDNLKKLLLESELFLEIERTISKHFEGDKISLLLYGSCAKNMQDNKSDIDFLAICKKKQLNSTREKASKLSDDLSDYFQKQIEILAIEFEEFVRLKKSRDPFIINVLSENKIILDELGVFK